MGSSAASAAPQYPPKVSANHRYMTDQTGAPWMMIADSPWGLMTQASVADASTYFAARQAQGYNAALISVLNTAGTPNADGCTYDGVCPFLAGNSESTFDISKPNPAYATRMQAMVNAAASQNIVVPSFTFVAFTTTVELIETTTGLKERLCGHRGVMQIASTSGLMIGPPAETL